MCSSGTSLRKKDDKEEEDPWEETPGEGAPKAVAGATEAVAAIALQSNKNLRRVRMRATKRWTWIDLRQR
jgi:hypothetical protein